MGLFGFGKKDDQPKEKPLSMVCGKYAGGYTNITKGKIDNLELKLFEDRIDLKESFMKVMHSIRIEDIVDAQIKSEEEISKDVTITRLLLVGIFAFGLKKTTKKDHRYIVIKTVEDGFENTLVLEYELLLGIDAGTLFVQQLRKQINECRKEAAE